MIDLHGQAHAKRTTMLWRLLGCIAGMGLGIQHATAEQNLQYFDLQAYEKPVMDAKAIPLPGQSISTPTLPTHGMFSAKLPAEWRTDEDVSDNTTVVMLAPSRGMGTGMLFVRRINVPAGADVRQLMAIAYEERISKMPLFHLLLKKPLKIAGQLGMVITGLYSYQGNVAYPRIVEEAAVVIGTEAFIMHFECMQSDVDAFGADMTGFYASVVFQTSASNAATAPDVLPPPSASVGKGMPLPFAFW